MAPKPAAYNVHEVTKGTFFSAKIICATVWVALVSSDDSQGNLERTSGDEKPNLSHNEAFAKSKKCLETVRLPHLAGCEHRERVAWHHFLEPVSGCLAKNAPSQAMLSRLRLCSRQSCDSSLEEKKTESGLVGFLHVSCRSCPLRSFCLTTPFLGKLRAISSKLESSAARWRTPLLILTLHPRWRM